MNNKTKLKKDTYNLIYRIKSTGKFDSTDEILTLLQYHTFESFEHFQYNWKLFEKSNESGHLIYFSEEGVKPMKIKIEIEIDSDLYVKIEKHYHSITNYFLTKRRALMEFLDNEK